jgi:hypothetical protein
VRIRKVRKVNGENDPGELRKAAKDDHSQDRESKLEGVLTQCKA